MTIQKDIQVWIDTYVTDEMIFSGLPENPASSIRSQLVVQGDFRLDAQKVQSLSSFSGFLYIVINRVAYSPSSIRPGHAFSTSRFRGTRRLDRRKVVRRGSSPSLQSLSSGSRKTLRSGSNLALTGPTFELPSRRRSPAPI